MYIKCTRVASKRGITDDGRHAESRCTRLYLLLREKTNSCRACIATRFARPPTPEKNSSRITRSRSTRSLIPSSIYACVCVCVCVRVSRTCASSIWRNWYWRRSSLERVRNGAEADILSLFLLRQSCAAYNLRTCGYVLRVAARSRHRVEVRYH